MVQGTQKLREISYTETCFSSVISPSNLPKLSNLTRFLTPQKVLPHIHNKKSRNKSPHVTVWLVVSNMFFHFIYGMSSFPLTFIFIFQDGGSTTKQQYICLVISKKIPPRIPRIALGSSIWMGQIDNPQVSPEMSFDYPAWDLHTKSY